MPTGSRSIGKPFARPKSRVALASSTGGRRFHTTSGLYGFAPKRVVTPLPFLVFRLATGPVTRTCVRTVLSSPILTQVVCHRACRLCILWSIKVSLIAYNIAHGGDGKLRRYWTWAGVLLVVVAIVIAPSVQAAGNVGFFTGLSRSSFGLDVNAGAIELSWAMYNWQEPSVRPGYIRPASVAQVVWRVAYAPWHVVRLLLRERITHDAAGPAAPTDASPPGAAL